MSKKAKKKQPSGPTIKPATIAWIAGTVAVVAVVGIFGFLVLTSDSDSELGTVVTQTPDPRVAGLTPTVFLEVEADDDGQAINPRFTPNQLSANAADVIEITLRNVGSVAHNLNLSGLDKMYDTPDGWVMPAIQPGDETKMVVKIDDPGQFPFRCDLHPQQQTGTLTLN